jgi:hypothetical protein
VEATGRPIAPLREVEALVAFEGRIAGTDPERRAAVHLADRLRSLNREAEVQPISVWPNYARTHALHALLAVVGSLVSVVAPLAGVLIVGFALLSALGDMTGTLFLLRRLTGRRASQNVVSPEGGEKAGNLVLVAHYDAARSGLLFSRRVLERRAALAQRLRLPVGLGGVFALAMLVVLLCTGLRALGLESLLISTIQFVPTAALVLATAVLADIQVSSPVPGAIDNASGVAAVLELARRYGGELDNFDVTVLLTGAQESLSLGMREWLRSQRSNFPPASTVVLNIDEVGIGTVRFAAREGLVVTVDQDPELVAICEDISDTDGEADSRFGARAHTSRTASDALLARARGYRAVTVSCLAALDYQPHHHQPSDTPDQFDSEAFERALGFCAELIERVDDELGPAVAQASQGGSG